MKTPINTITMNTSTSFNIIHENALGWQKMPVFSVETAEIELGWDAMPAFGALSSSEQRALLSALAPAVVLGRESTLPQEVLLTYGFCGCSWQMLR